MHKITYSYKIKRNNNKKNKKKISNIFLIFFLIRSGPYPRSMEAASRVNPQKKAHSLFWHGFPGSTLNSFQKVLGIRFRWYYLRCLAFEIFFRTKWSAYHFSSIFFKKFWNIWTETRVFEFYLPARARGEECVVTTEGFGV